MIARMANQKISPSTIVGVTEKIALPQKSSGMGQGYVARVGPRPDSVRGAPLSPNPEYQHDDGERRGDSERERPEHGELPHRP